MVTFKPGDVILYEDNYGWVIEAITNGKLKSDRWVLTDWYYKKVIGGGGSLKHMWKNSDDARGSLASTYCKPHPNPDEFLARYTAHRLVNG